MSPELLSALEQAERSEPQVRAAALMHIARVAAVPDPALGVEFLHRGIAIARGFESGVSSLLLRNGIYLAAGVSPKDAIQLYAECRKTDPFGAEVIGLVNALAEHNNVDAAIAYLSDPLPGDGFPLHFVNNLERRCRDDNSRLKILRLAAREWTGHVPDRHDPHADFAGPAFNAFFGRSWKLLPPDEARSVLKKLLRWVLKLETPAQPCPLTNDSEDPAPSSEKEFLLFQILPAIEALDPHSAHGLLARYPNLAAVARRFPNGMQSVWDETPAFDRARDDAMTVGHSAVMYMSEALATDFAAAFQSAQELYAQDSDADDPNQAPKECWPSAREYRNILFKSGQHLGMEANKYLEQISDPDLRLFAQIEPCAAAAGLPQIGGCTVSHATKAQFCALSPAELDELMGAPLAGIRCPECGWIPRAENEWSCECGHAWNTFETRGVCPQCERRREVTACLQCGEMPSHEKWYSGD